MEKFNSDVIKVCYNNNGSLQVEALFEFDESITHVFYPLIRYAINMVLKYHDVQDQKFLIHIKNEFSRLYYSIRLEQKALDELNDLIQGDLFKMVDERGIEWMNQT
ncbi:MAG: hypothetical protein KAS32_12090 [Candidatus Peribacteraceae bacterium]|nr:hypothetical protein [Candidatus Peribacteraceae bacterium]